MQVRAADAAAHHPDADVTLTELGRRAGLDAQLGVLAGHHLHRLTVEPWTVDSVLLGNGVFGTGVGGTCAAGRRVWRRRT